MVNFGRRLILLQFFLINQVYAVDFHRTFKLRRNNVDSDEDGRVVSIIRKLTKIEEKPDIVDVPTLAPIRIISGFVNNEKIDYDPCEVLNMCLNGGVCVSRGKEFYCNCPITHYGKTCEFRANQYGCNGNKCKNNATCYSTKEPVLAINPIKLPVPESFDRKSSRFQDLAVLIYYQCWCRDGFEGTFCEYTKGMRQCLEDKCNYHGVAVQKESDYGPVCECHCEKFYSGDECQIISPCRDLTCLNNSTCVLNDDGTARCECPKGVEILKDVTITGDNCEIARVSDENVQHLCFPCRSGFVDWINCVKTHFNASEEIEALKEDWLKQCKQINPQCLDRLKIGECLDGRCQAAVVFNGPNLKNKLFLYPKCACSKEYEGIFCEKERLKPCDLSPLDQISMIERCKNNGECLDDMENNTIICKCLPGFKGSRCELPDPCVPNPCDENALCVEMAVVDENGKGVYACICNSSQEYNMKKRHCENNHFLNCTNSTTGQPQCQNDGSCYPCGLDLRKGLDLCDKEETRRGFRCVCPMGFKPPFCSEHLSPCEHNYCLNGGKCVASDVKDYDYSCDCPPGYEGSNCHIILDICLRKGNLECKNGKCIPDSNTHREFYCDCDLGYYGINCQHWISIDIVPFFMNNYIWILPFLTFLFVVIALYTISRLKRDAKKFVVVVVPGTS